MIGPYASEARNEEQDKKEEAESEAPEPDIIQRTTHLPQASQPAFEDPKFLEENSWWTEPTGQQAPTKACLDYNYDLALLELEFETVLHMTPTPPTNYSFSGRCSSCF